MLVEVAQRRLVRAVDALIPLARTSVIAAGMIADALRDGHPTVRHRAFAALRQVSEPLDAVQLTADPAVNPSGL